MPGHIAGGYFTVPFVRVGGPEDFNVRTSLAGAVYHNDRSPWEMLLSLFGPSEVAANYLRIIRLDILPEFAAVARDEDEFLAVLVRPYLEGCRSPGTGSLLRCPVETARHDSWALTKMWQHARRHVAWLQEDSQDRAEAWDRTWRLGRLPHRACRSLFLTPCWSCLPPARPPLPAFAGHGRPVVLDRRPRRLPHLGGRGGGGGHRGEVPGGSRPGPHGHPRPGRAKPDEVRGHRR